MIAGRTFTKDWLYTVNKRLNWNRQETQLKNLEKAVAALHLLELLAETKMRFLFKGGTSLLLLLQRIYRLSVDIDIIVEDAIDYIDVFSIICSKSKLFTHFEQQERESNVMHGTKHYKFFYMPFAAASEESYILLDLYESANPYAKVLELELVSGILETEGKNVLIRVPDVDSMLGDKLTAFAPSTIGISLTAEPGHRPKRIEVLKQLFDVGNLFDFSENIESIRETHYAISMYEIRKRGSEITVADVLKDSARHAYIIGHGGKVDKPTYDTIAKGYKDFNKFVADLSFDENQAILSAAKVAYLVSVLLLGSETLEKYDSETIMDTWSIPNESYVAFNDYKYSNPEAFFYWYKALTNKSP